MKLWICPNSPDCSTFDAILDISGFYKISLGDFEVFTGLQRKIWSDGLMMEHKRKLGQYESANKK